MIKDLRMALQTKVPLKLGETIPDFSGKLQNVTDFFEESAKRNLKAHIIESSSIYLKGKTPWANAYILEPTENFSDDYKTLLVSKKEMLNLNTLDGLLIRGDDIQENPSLDHIYPLINKNKVYIPVDYFESKKTKDKLDLVNEFKDFNMPLTMYSENSVKDLNEKIFTLFDNGHQHVVLKYRWGHGGQHLTRLDKNDPNMLDIASDFMNTYKQIIVQEYDYSVKDGDIRVVVLDNKPLIAYERKSLTGDWKNSITQGSSWSVFDLNDDQKKYCADISSHYPKTKFLGLDLFKSMNIIEINAYCGGTNTAKQLTGVNIIGNIFEEAERLRHKK